MPPLALASFFQNFVLPVILTSSIVFFEPILIASVAFNSAFLPMITRLVWSISVIVTDPAAEKVVSAPAIEVAPAEKLA